jgi:hypothetical protein
VIAESKGGLPECTEAGVAAVRLLQGVVYGEDVQAWDAILANESELTDYFLKIGLVLVIDTTDAMAYLRQLTDDERSGRFESMPRLFRRQTLGYDATMLCVLLRDELRRFEDEDLENERCVIDFETIFDSWKGFFAATEDEIRLRRRMASALSKLEKMKFVRPFQSGKGAWEIRRILKARLTVTELQQLRDQLAAWNNAESATSVGNSRAEAAPDAPFQSNQHQED